MKKAKRPIARPVYAHDPETNGSFRVLNPAEEAKLRKWARLNYAVGTPIAMTWHPAVRDECRKMTTEKEQG